MNTDRESSLHGVRSDGMGALPHRPAASRARPVYERDSRAALSYRDEAAGEDRRGAVTLDVVAIRYAL